MPLAGAARTIILFGFAGSGLLALMICCLLGLVVSPQPDHISPDREARLRPVIRYIDRFIEDHGRLPTQEQFQAKADEMDEMLVLKDRTDAYAAKQGATKETDYMVGIWRADWFHYYKSWDRSFLNGHDEFPNAPD